MTTMTTDIDACAWSEKTLTVPIELGEIRLFNPTFDGLTCSPDIFNTEPLAELKPPAKALQKHKQRLAFAYSFPLEPGLEKFRVKSGIVSIVESTYKHFYVDTRKNFDQYIGSKSKKTVSTLKRKIRKIEATNTSAKTFQICTTPDELADFFALASPVSEKSYQQRLWRQGLPRTEEFKKEVIEKSKSGKIIGYILNVHDKPVAYNLCPVYGDTKVLYDITGYDSDYSKFSPGTVLQYKIIEDLFQRSDIEFYDLCTGEGAHKELFATDSILCGNIYFFQAHPKYVATFSCKFLFAAMTGLAVRLLTLIGAKERLKRFIRRSA